MRRGLAAEAQRLWLQQAFDVSSVSVSELHREVAAALTVLGETIGVLTYNSSDPCFRCYADVCTRRD